jgi:uncharacterized membrane protein SirB2
LKLVHVHVTTAALSFALFFLRGVWMLQGSGRLRRRWVRVLPHVNDSVLLVSAGLLAVRVRQYPFVDAWLTAKVTALLLYILLGMVALHWGASFRIRLGAWLAAMTVFGYIVAVALTRDPLPALP